MKKNWIMIAVLAVLSCLCVKYSDSVFAAVGILLDVLSPLILGFMVAYVLNILMKKLEKIYFPKRTDKWVQKTRRPVCLFGSLFLVFLAVIILTLLVIPALADSIYVLTKDIPKAFIRFQKWLSALAAEAGFSEIQSFVNSLEIDWADLYRKAADALTYGIGSIFNSAFTMANGIISFTVTAAVAVIFAVYMLSQKEKLKAQFQAATQVYMPEKWRVALERFLAIAHDTFTSFISGQVLEACILGTLCGVGMFLLKLPYALMIGVTIGVSALIPVMGAYLGAAIGAFMIMTVSPLKALGFLVFLALLQQIEGNLIYPRVVGGSIGLPGIWVLAAVTVGGGLFGIPGMLIGVPLTATLYKWLRSDVGRRLEENRVMKMPHIFRKTEDEVQADQKKQ